MYQQQQHAKALLQLEMEQDPVTTCCVEHISQCPSARILKVLLKRIGKAIESTIEPTADVRIQMNQNYNVQMQINQIIDAMMTKHQHSATKLRDDLQHLKYDHGLYADDTKFDVAYEFFKECLAKTGCAISRCPFIRCYFSAETTNNTDSESSLLMKTVAEIHCYLLHSLDVCRLTKAERDRVDAQSKPYGISTSDDLLRMQLASQILDAKKQRFNTLRQLQTGLC